MTNQLDPIELLLRSREDAIGDWSVPHIPLVCNLPAGWHILYNAAVYLQCEDTQATRQRLMGFRNKYPHGRSLATNSRIIAKSLNARRKAGQVDAK